MLGGGACPGNAPGYARPFVAPAWAGGVRAPHQQAVMPHKGGYGPAGVRAPHQQAVMPYKGVRPRPQLVTPPALAGPRAGFMPAVPTGVMRQGSLAGQAVQADLHVANIVKEFALAATDFGTSEQQLEFIFQRLQDARHIREAVHHGTVRAVWQQTPVPGMVTALPTLPAGPASQLGEADVQQRRELVLRAISARLQAIGGVEPLEGVTSDPTIASLRKGAVASFTKFLSEFPEYFEIGTGPSPKEGKSQIQMVRLLQPVPPGLSLASGKRKREELPEVERREALLQSLVDALSDLGGYARIADLGVDSRVRTATVGINTKLQKFISEYPEVFALSEAGDPVHATLLVDPATAVSMANVRAKMQANADTVAQSLTEEVEAALVLAGGEVPLSTLAESPTISSHRKCLNVTLKKFLAQFPERFDLLGENNAVRVRLIAGLC